MELPDFNQKRSIFKWAFFLADIPTELCREVFNEDVAAEMCDFVMKYVLFDDVFDHDHADEDEEEEKAIPPKQMDIWEICPEYLD